MPLTRDQIAMRIAQEVEDGFAKKSMSVDSMHSPIGQILGVLQPSVNSDGYDDDKMSVASRMSMRPQAPPKSRQALSQHEMDDDLMLEEAWIDSKILIAKERRRAEKRSSKRSGHRHVLSPPMQPQHSIMIASDRRPPRRSQEV